MTTQEFERYLFARKGLAPITVKGYLSGVRRVESIIGDITLDSAERYICDLYKKEYSYSYKANTVSAIEHWLEFIGTPTRFGRQKKPRPIIKNTLTEGEVTRLLLVCKNTREQAIISLLAYSGLRPKEMCNVRVEDIDFGANTLIVREGKGSKDAIIYISRRCVVALQEYIRESEQVGYLFRTYYGNKYSVGALRKLVNVLARRAKMQKQVYPYLFRHSLATNMLARGANIMTIKAQLRHAWIETTLIYLHSVEYSTRNEYEQFVPSYL